MLQKDDKDFIEAMKSQSQSQSATSNRNGSDSDNLINPKEFNEPINDELRLKIEVKAEVAWFKSVHVICFIIILGAIAIAIATIAKLKIGNSIYLSFFFIILFESNLNERFLSFLR